MQNHLNLSDYTGKCIVVKASSQRVVTTLPGASFFFFVTCVAKKLMGFGQMDRMPCDISQPWLEVQPELWEKG